MTTAAGFLGKTRQDPKTRRITATLPLVAHCLDVALVFAAIARIPLVWARLDAAAGRKLTDGDIDRLAVPALLHDLGKTNLGFQDQAQNPRSRVGHIAPIQALVSEADLGNNLFQVFGDLWDWFDPAEGLDAFLLAAWSHHGAPVRFDPAVLTGDDPQWWRPHGDRDPLPP